MTKRIDGCTGHRPHRLGGFTRQTYSRLRALATEYLVDAKPDEVVSGMALGWDQAFAYAAIDLRIPVTAAIPFDDYETMWPGSSRLEYKKLLAQCENVVIVTPGPYTDASLLFKRNRWVADNVTNLAALFDGNPRGGTFQCLLYATSKKPPVLVENLWERWLGMKNAT